MQAIRHKTRKIFFRHQTKKRQEIFLSLFVVEDCRGEAECSLIKGKNTNAHKRKTYKTKLLS